MNISIDSAALQRVMEKHIGIVLWVFLVLVIIFEVVVIKRSVDLIRSVHNQTLPFPTQIVRVNNNKYNDIAKQIEESANYSADLPTVENPFGLAPRRLENP